MRGLPDLPDLQIVPTDMLLPHEEVDEGRTGPLVARMREEGILRNPPIAIQSGDRSGHYVVLDGANRTVAFRMMELPHALVQVVHAGSTSVQLLTWNHVLSVATKEAIVEAIEKHPDLALVPSDEDRAGFNLSSGGTLAYMVFCDGRVLEVVGETTPLEWGVRNLQRLAVSYQGLARIDRVSTASPRGLAEVYPGFTALVVFRAFSVEEVVAAATMGLLFPAGLTRFVVSPRALRLNFPLSVLAGGEAIEEKQKELSEWVRERVGGRHVRFYAESTFLFDE
jgi:hypothetical protein